MFTCLFCWDFVANYTAAGWVFCPLYGGVFSIAKTKIKMKWDIAFYVEDEFVAQCCKLAENKL